MKPLMIGLAMLFLWGCASPIWLKDSATTQDFERDKFDCEHKVVTMYGGYGQMGVGHAILARDDMKRCLRSLGYREANDEERARIEQTQSNARP